MDFHHLISCNLFPKELLAKICFRWDCDVGVGVSDKRRGKHFAHHIDRMYLMCTVSTFKSLLDSLLQSECIFPSDKKTFSSAIAEWEKGS